MHSKILINEFFPDPVGPDKGWEWIEIVNISDEQINLSGWEIQRGGVNYNRAFRFPEESIISPNEYILICEEYVENCDYYTPNLAMQNGINKTDGVRILDNSGKVINTVLYSRPNRNELKNDHGEIEKDENIIKMPEEGYSFSRKDFSNTGFSILDFFTTNKPTPGEENVFKNNVIISEVGIDFIEFYSSKIPQDLSSWYIKESINSDKKVFLENKFKNNFFILETQKPFENIYLYSPENILVDSFSVERLSSNFTYCRLNSLLEENFSFCEETKEGKNELKNWKSRELLEIIQMGVKDPFIVEICSIYAYENLFIISDQTAALAIECDNCKNDECFLGEIFPFSKLDILEKTEIKHIDFETVNKGNYVDLFNKIVILKGKVFKSKNDSSYLDTSIGLVKVQGDKLLPNNEYTLKGILLKNEDMHLSIEYPVILEKKPLKEISELEQTGDPLIFLTFFFLLPFLLSKFFVKLWTINFKK